RLGEEVALHHPDEEVLREVLGVLVGLRPADADVAVDGLPVALREQLEGSAVAAAGAGPGEEARPAGAGEVDGDAAPDRGPAVPSAASHGFQGYHLPRSGAASEPRSRAGRESCGSTPRGRRGP